MVVQPNCLYVGDGCQMSHACKTSIELQPVLTIALCLFLANFTAPSAVRNVTTVSVMATSIVLSWLPPEPANGVLRRYVVRYVDASGIEEQQEVYDLNTTLTDLTPYTLYNVSISGVTVDTGPPKTIQVKTDESGRVAVILFSP